MLEPAAGVADMNAPRNRTDMRRAMVILPGVFTFGSLFFGVWSIVAGTRGEFTQAAWCIGACVLLDSVDGPLARMTRTDTAFGAELDSLVDAVSFGVAPALLAYFHTYQGSDWGWLLSFWFVAAAVLRLARFNVGQAGRAKSQFVGLPSPGAAIALATYFPFTQTPLFQRHLAGLWPSSVGLGVLVIACSMLMVSHVSYPCWPRLGVRSAKEMLSLAVAIVAVMGVLLVPESFVFLFAAGYIAFGAGRAGVLGVLGHRRADPPQRP